MWGSDLKFGWNYTGTEGVHVKRDELTIVDPLIARGFM